MRVVGKTNTPPVNALLKIAISDIRNGAGDADALFLGEAPMSTPKATDAVVKIKAFGLNRMDTLQREGKYPVPPQASKVLGVEFSGTVHELGGQAESDFKVGDEVFGLAYGGMSLIPLRTLLLGTAQTDGPRAGAYAEYIAVSTHMLIHKPRELSWEEAAGVPEASLPFFAPLLRLQRTDSQS